MQTLFAFVLLCLPYHIQAQSKWDFRTVTAELLTNGETESNCWTADGSYYKGNNNYATDTPGTIAYDEDVKITDGTGKNLFPGVTFHTTHDGGRQIDYLRVYPGSGIFFNSGNDGYVKFSATEGYYYKVTYRATKDHGDGNGGTTSAAVGINKIESGGTAVGDLTANLETAFSTEGTAVIKATATTVDLQIASSTVISCIEVADFYRHDYNTDGQTGYIWTENDADTEDNKANMVSEKILTATAGVLDDAPSDYEAWVKNGGNSRSVILDLSDKAAITTNTYTVSFDAFLKKGDKVHDNNKSELALLSATSQYNGGNMAPAANRMFRIYSTNGGDWYLNDDTETALDIDGQWLHYAFTVNVKDKELNYTITKREGSTPVANGTVTLAAGNTLIKGMRSLLGFNDPNTNYTAFYFDNLTISAGEEASYLFFDEKSKTYNITDQNFTEPKMYYSAPAGSYVDYDVSNSSIAKIGSKKGDTEECEVHFYEGGNVTVTATLKNSSGEELASDSYDVKVIAGDATYDITTSPDYGTVYTLTGAGKLNERTVTFPGLTMEFGYVGDKLSDNETTNLNITLVKDYTGDLDNPRYVAETLGNDGWRDFSGTIYDTHDVPQQGTFYTFKPTVDGILTLSGSNYSNGTYDAVLVNATDGYAPVTAEVGTGNISTASHDNVQFKLVGGKTYYLYGKNQNCYGVATGLWTVYQLHSFAFKSDFRFTNSSVRVAKATFESSGYTQAPVQSTSPTYEIWDDQTNAYVVAGTQGGSGGLRATIDNAGKVTYVSGDGGAVVVKCTSGSVSIHYVITVPYDLSGGKSHKWDFTNIANRTDADLTAATADWNINYKARSYSADGSKMLEYLNKPVWTNSAPLNGDNAMYVNETAGLIVNGSARNFGYNATINGTTAREELEERTKLDSSDANYIDPTSAEYTIELNKALREMLTYGSDRVQDFNLLTTYKTTTTIPDLKAGQYVIMYWDRHSAGSGSNFEFTNLTDLNGTDLTTDLQITGVLPSGSRAGKGAYVFKVKADGDVSFRSINGWVDLYSIEVTSVKSSDMRLVIDANGTASDANEVKLDNANIIYRGTLSAENPATLKVARGSAASIFPKESYDEFVISSDEFEVEVVGGVTTTTSTKVSTSGNNNYTPVEFRLTGYKGDKRYGNIKITQNVYDMSQTFLIDRRETWFAVGQLDVQNYPATWDFTARNMDASPTGSSFKNLNSGTDEYGKWTDSKIVLAKTVDSTDGTTVLKPTFAQGAQLSIGTADGNTITETVGLGVKLKDINDNYDGNGVTLTSGSLYFPIAGVITVPALHTGTADVYVYVKADKQVKEVSSQGGKISKLTSSSGDYQPQGDGIYGFKVTDQVNLELDVPAGTNIYEIAVTDIAKSLTKVGAQAWATESRDVCIDHRLTGELTKSNVKAYIVNLESYDEGTATVSQTEVNVVPENTGILLNVASADHTMTVPLFRNACNITSSDDFSTNMLRPNVNARTDFSAMTENEDGTDGANNGTGGEYTRFIFTTTYYTWNGSSWSESQQKDYASFIRMKSNNSGNMGANKSYLRVQNIPAAAWYAFESQGESAKSGYIFLTTDDKDSDEQEGTETTAISSIGDGEEHAEQIYYTVNGVRLNGRPRQKGIYICNGVKVVIK